MKASNAFLICIFQILFFDAGISQEINDIQSWNTMALSKQFSDKYSTSLIVIHRITDNISRYNSVSFDLRLSRKIHKGFSGQVLIRNWSFTQSEPVYFIWYEILHVHKQASYKWVNLLRVHHGLDWVGKEEPDFIRWRSHYFIQLPKTAVVPFVGYDLWYRLNGNHFFQNVWLELGAEYNVDKLRFRLNYRRITHFKNRPGWKRHLVVLGLFYKIGKS